MKILDVMQAAGGRVSGGDPYLWDCYGSKANFMEFRDVDGNGYSHCIFDTKTYQVYEVHVEVPLTTNEADAPQQAFRWIDPEYLPAYLKECKDRDESPVYAWDDFKYVDISSDATILEYVKDIGEGYYDNLPIPETQE